MNTLLRNVTWYQSKIGEHDKQSWEQTVEGKILSSIDNLPKKDATKQNRDLLDVDLVKGSTFTKAKPSHTSYIRTWKGLVRILFLPFFYKWWIQHTSHRFLAGAMILYIAQICVTLIYYNSSDAISSSTSLFEVTNPLMFMFVLSVMHTQIVFTQSSTKHTKYSSSRKFTTPQINKMAKRTKKNNAKPTKLTKRKFKANSSSRQMDLQTESQLSVKKISSDSSEDVDEALLRVNGDYMESTDILDENEEDCFSSEESTLAADIKEQRTPRVMFVPDVAADAEERHTSVVSPLHTTEAQRPRDFTPEQATHLQTRSHESEGTSDIDSPTRPCTSDTEWENNRVCNSDVASDSSSDYVSDEEKEEEPSVEGPICLKQKVSHTLAYVPSVYDRISCIIWENEECKKVDLSVPDLGGVIERQVANLDYEPSEVFVTGIIFTVLVASFPFLFRLYYSPRLIELLHSFITGRVTPDRDSLKQVLSMLCGSSWQESLIVTNGLIQRACLCGLFCFLVIVAEKSYWQRLQYAKFFCCLTSARKSKKYSVPHFRLNKVKNIKVWLSLRAYLKKRGPQRSVEVIVCSVFFLMVTFLAIMCIQLLNDLDSFLLIYGNWELTLCCMALTCYLLRFYSLGTKIAKKYRCLSTLITEQINLYLHMEQKPHKKDDLLVASSVLKLAESLIKEIESPYKMSSTLINPVVFNFTRLVMLSAFSAVISELLGFKLKLYKVKM